MRYLPRFKKSKFVSIRGRPNHMNLVEKKLPSRTDLEKKEKIDETRWSGKRILIRFGEI